MFRRRNRAAAAGEAQPGEPNAPQSPVQAAGQPDVRPVRLRERPVLVVISSGILLVSSLIIILIVLAALYRWLAQKSVSYPDFALPMLLLAAIVVFFSGIAVLVSVYRSVGMTDKRHALGLPEGSVRAIIALILIFFFFVAITFIYFSAARGGPDRALQGVTPAQFAQIPISDLISSTPVPATGIPTSYNAVVRGTVSPTAQDIGKNVISILGTLIAAIAAFYFGSKSATSAAVAGAQIRAGRTAPPLPEVVRVSPAGGPAAGGTLVTLAGSGLTDVTAVHFGAAPAPDFVFSSDTQITAITPPGTGTVTVTVTTPAGISAGSPLAAFTYSPVSPQQPAGQQAPQLDDVRPFRGEARGGTRVVLSGSGFTGATAVYFGDSRAPYFATDSETQITAVTPAGTGTADVTITTPAGVSAPHSGAQFTYSDGDG